MAAFSKTKPLDFVFGLGDQAFDAEGRVISLLFRDVIVVGTYNPQGGFTTESLAEKVAWEKQLGIFLSKLRVRSGWEGRPVVWGGDLNVNPTRDDWTFKAWEHVRHKLKDQIPAGCRDIDIQSYTNNVAAIDGATYATNFPHSPASYLFCE